MLKINIKAAKPFIEKVVQAEGVKENITIGVLVSNQAELETIREEYQDAFSTVKLDRWRAELQELRTNTELDEDSFDSRVRYLEKAIKEKEKSFIVFHNDFCKKHIQYIKNASLSIEQDGKSTDLLVADTRDAKPIESLWEDEASCLVVLLDTYLSSPFYKDSLYTSVISTVFNTNFKAEELKNSKG